MAPGSRQKGPGVFLQSVCRDLLLLAIAAVALAACSPATESGAAKDAVVTTVTESSAKVGKRVFDRACVACHGAGLAGAPKLGDADAWRPRIAQGREVLLRHALEGFEGQSGIMPPKGGHRYLDDADIAAAVDYMLEAAR